MTTKQDVINNFGCSDVNQIGKKQLFTAVINNTTVLISYNTIVGYKDSRNVWHYTNKRYSITTVKHINQHKRGHTCFTDKHFDFILALHHAGISGYLLDF